VIDAKAKELGRMLGQSEEYKQLKRASDRLKEDAELGQLMRDLEGVAQQIEDAGRGGAEPAPDLINRYEELVSKLQASPVYQGVIAAQTNFDKLMAKVNADILEGIKAGAASPIITLS
jgi:cell fate (sporulation/competence/biofilm development) regulator YlbF (YheA/YmcA/DUF963 family)